VNSCAFQDGTWCFPPEDIDGFKTFLDRWREIMNSPEASGKIEAAMYMALHTDIDACRVRIILARISEDSPGVLH
jgi:hypothetical protein